MKPKSLYSQLEMSKILLEQRVQMIPKYVYQEGWLGKNHYTMDMIPPIKKQIEELEAALEGIRKWRASKRKRVTPSIEAPN